MFFRLGFRFALLGVVLAAVTVWHYTDRAFNFVEVEGRIDAVSAQCHVNGARGSLFYVDDCDEIATMVGDGKVAPGDVRRTTRVSVRYASPADGQVHSGKFTVSGTADPALVAGGVTNIYASKTAADRIERN